MAIGLNVLETLMVCENCIRNFKILSYSILKLSVFLHTLLPNTIPVVLLSSLGCDVTSREQ